MRSFAALFLTVISAVSAATLTLPDLDNKPVQLLHDSRTVVFIFTRTDCPISNRYAPEVRRLYEEFGPKNVTFWLVYVDPKEPVEAIRKHMDEYSYPFSALIDRHHELVKLTDAKITPEAAVYAGGKLVYRGRIDDRYIAFGKSRQAPQVHDLEQLLASVTRGEQPAFKETKAIGCFIEDLRQGAFRPATSHIDSSPR